MVALFCTFIVNIGSSSRAEAAPRPYPVRFVADDVSYSSASPSGGFVVANRVGENEWLRVETASGAQTPISRPGQITDDGSTIWRVAVAGGLEREVIGGATTNFGQVVAAATGEDWAVSGVVGLDGARVIVFASNGGLGQTRNFLYDPALGSVVAQPADAGPTQPAEHNALLGSWSTSDDDQWVTFWSDQDDVVPGLTGVQRRLFRRQVESGLTQHLPNASADSNSRAQVYDGGRVVMLQEGPANSSTQIYVSDGAATPILLTQGPDGEAPNGNVEVGFSAPPIYVNSDATRIIFSSFASGLDGNRPEGVRRLYESTLPGAAGVVESGKLAASEAYCFAPKGATPGDFIALNATPLFAEAGGFGTLHSSDVAAGGTANVNFAPGSVDPNVGFVEVGSDGRVCITNSVHGGVHLVLDELIVGSSAAFSAPTAAGATRLADTRFDVGGSRLAASESLCVATQGASAGDVVGINITPVLADASGFGVLHSSDDAAGSTANVNFGPGTVDPNLAFATVGSDGEICYTNSEHGGVDVILDELIVGVASAFSSPTADGAARLADTRFGVGGSTLPAHGKVCVAVEGAAAGDFVGINITPVLAEAGGFGVLHSSDDPAGGTANVNFSVGTVDPNLAFAEVGTDGEVCFTNSVHGSVEVILDQLIVATASSFSSPTADGSVRLADTRIGRTT